MRDLAAEVGQALLKRQARMVTAESCTGGWVAELLTQIPGSSAWFDAGYVTYSNAAKQRMLGVSAEVLEDRGAVSEAVVVQMAEGALRHAGVDIAVAISGVAGPDGGTPRKPVGTVWFAWAIRDHATVTCLSFFSGDRQSVRAQAVEQALEGILAYLPQETCISV
ncbi:MAG: nicotinamide-nucleotide amidase [Nitrincola lacisaponensis]|uniref:C-terminal domain of CinA type S n=1 Tax=Nitrincola lacisaponensis TaxID=267850 RepID=A0A063Y6Z3_9GAMM|nr:nicotinamide-nucleotide amidase [Nitrincola lacisaponensis]KDE40506.1 C-terminal domain of CinA type S [Nitrincola lacisaponensis]